MGTAAMGMAASNKDAASEEAAASAATWLDDAFLIELPWMCRRLFSRPGKICWPSLPRQLTLPQGTTEGCTCGEITCEVERQLRR